MEKNNNILDRVVNLHNQYGFGKSLVHAMGKESDYFKNQLGDASQLEEVYSRKIIAKQFRDNQGSNQEPNYEVILVNWLATQAPGEIHGHPQFMYYQILSGAFLVRFYEICENGNMVYLQSSRYFLPGEVFAYCADKPTSSNGVHSIQCMKPGKTLHVYSDDASVCKKFITNSS